MPLEAVGKITKISFNKGKWIIEFTCFDKLKISSDVYVEYYFYVGKEITKEEYLNIQKRNEINEGIEYAKRIIANKLYTEKEIISKLKLKKYKAPLIKEIVDELKRLSLLDDKKYKDEYIEYKNDKLISNNKIKHELKTKGIKLDSSDLDNEDIESSKAKKRALKTFNSKSNYSFKKRKETTLNDLLRNGFSYDLSYQVISSFDKLKDEEEEINLLRKEYLKLSNNNYDKDTICKKLINKGFEYHDIKKVMEGEENEVH